MSEAPDGLSVRPATLADVDEISALVTDVETADIGISDYGIDELREDLAEPPIDLRHDSWLAFRGDRLICFGIVWERNRGGRIEIDHYVRREDVPDGEYVLGLILARCADIAAAHGVPETVVGLGLTPQSVLGLGPLERLGWRNDRRYNVMSKPVSVDGDPVPVVPEGIVIRHPDGEPDRRIAHAMLDECFADHYEHHSWTYDEWIGQGRGHYNEPLSWIASIRLPDGTVEDVGILLGRNNRETMGWVRALGVLKPARGKGIGTLLLRLAFAAFARIGRDTVGLGVDTGNTTGALGVYERAGMTRLYAVDAWKITVRASCLAASAGAPGEVR
jgi:GNAT superfamily N-acetyltransferase